MHFQKLFLYINLFLDMMIDACTNEKPVANSKAIKMEFDKEYMEEDSKHLLQRL